MKKLLLCLWLATLASSCLKSDDTEPIPELIGTWKLVAVYNDPGDGSGDYVTVESSKVLTFKTSNVLTSNGTICNMSITSDAATTGTYSITDGVITATDCEVSHSSIRFSIKGANLVVSYPCIEGCLSKFVKI